MLYLVIFCLFASLTLYIVLAGADFGAGILELFTRKKNRQYVANVTTKAMGPVWEANHVWLILVIVILFTGFPRLHTLLVTHLHLPILLLLLGIIIRGTAFVFRHYDAVKDGSQKHYRNAFIYSSALTPLFLGMIAGAGIKGDFPAVPTDFYSAFIAPWFNLFAFLVGIFTVSICGYLAAVFIIGDVEAGPDRRRYAAKARLFLGGLVVSGALVFLRALQEELPFLEKFMAHPLSIGAVIAATVSLPLLWYILQQLRFNAARVIAAGQVMLILIAVYVAMFPDFVLGGGAGRHDLFSAAAPDKTIHVLGWALVAGLSIIGPSVAYLMWIFKGRRKLPDDA